MGINFQRVNYKYSPLSPLTLKDITFNVDKCDEFICILGHTGSGKSTLVQNMNALFLPTSGQINIFNKDVVKKVVSKYKLNTKKNYLKYNVISKNKLFIKINKLIYSSNLKDARKHIGLVFQFPEYQLFEINVLKDVMFGPKNFGLSESDAKNQAIRACKLVGLDQNIFDKNPFSLSGGQQRRVAIAGILALNPDIIVLDEPTVGLDPKGKEELLELLVKIQLETHKSIIMITHDMDVVGKYAKRVMVMEKGHLVFDGNKRVLFENFDKLKELNLDLPISSEIAIKLKEQGLIKYTHLPLSKEELQKVILGGDIYE